MDNVKIVTVSSAIRGLGYSSIWVYGSIYMTKFLGLPTVAASLVFMSGGLVASISQFAGGALGDSIGHRKVFIAFLFALFLVSSVLATIHSISTSSLLFPVIFGVIMVLNALQSPSSNALVSRSSSVQLKGFSIMRVGNNLGWGFGPAIGGFILSLYGFPGIFYFFMIASLLSCAISLFTSKVEPKGKSVSFKFNRENSALIVISIAAMLVFMVQAQETLSLSLYAYGIFSGAYFEIGIVYMVNGILVVLTQPIFYKISSRIGEYSSLIIGTFIYSLGFLSYGFDSNLPQMILSTAIFTMGENLSFPTGYSIVASISRKERIGTNIGLYNSLISVGRSFGPLIGGLLLPVVTNHILFWFYVCIPGFASVAILILCFRLIRDYQIKFNREGLSKF